MVGGGGGEEDEEAHLENMCMVVMRIVVAMKQVAVAGGCGLAGQIVGRGICCTRFQINEIDHHLFFIFAIKMESLS